MSKQLEAKIKEQQALLDASNETIARLNKEIQNHESTLKTQAEAHKKDLEKMLSIENYVDDLESKFKYYELLNKAPVGREIEQAFIKTQTMLKELQKQLYFNAEHNVSLLIAENEKLLESLN